MPARYMLWSDERLMSVSSQASVLSRRLKISSLSQCQRLKISSLSQCHMIAHEPYYFKPIGRISECCYVHQKNGNVWKRCKADTLLQQNINMNWCVAFWVAQISNFYTVFQYFTRFHLTQHHVVLQRQLSFLSLHCSLFNPWANDTRKSFYQTTK